MKPIQIALGFVAGAIVALLVSKLGESPYHFLSGQDGQIVWRCDRETGEVKTFTSFNNDSFEIWKGSTRDFFFNKKTGQVWRYLQNDSNSLPDEGFAPLDFGNPVAVKK